jgi:YVTN family beta-propeller protein
MAINLKTNKVYLISRFRNTVTVVDGATNATTTVAVGFNPCAVALNPVTNKIYVANLNSSNVTIIDGVTNATATIAVESAPCAIAINPVTNKIYVISRNSNTVTVIDGVTNAATNIVTKSGSNPIAIAVNSTTNKIYVIHQESNNTNGTVTVIDGLNKTTAIVTVGIGPCAVAINPMINKIYVANEGDNGNNTVTIINGSDNSTKTIATGIVSSSTFGNFNIIDMAINPKTNKIYLIHQRGQAVTVVDGATNTTKTISVETDPCALAINDVTDRIYLISESSNTVTVIDGVTDTTTYIVTETNPYAVAVNPVTNTVYIVNNGNTNVTVINGSDNSLLIPVNIDGCLKKDIKSGNLILTDLTEDGGEYYLIGHTAELSKLIGYRLKVTGRNDSPPTPSSDNPIPLKVSSWQVIVDPHKEIQPNVGKVADWKSYENRMYGIRIRTPKTFEVLNNSDDHSYAAQDHKDSTGAIELFNMDIPMDIYGNYTLFDGGYLSVCVKPDIQSAGPCKLFDTDESQEAKIATRTLNGIPYTQATQWWSTMGSGDELYFLHTYQNGLCYTFNFHFRFRTANGSILTIEDFYCAHANYDSTKLIDLLLSNVSFFKPSFKGYDFVMTSHDIPTACSNFKKKFTGTIGSNIKVNWQLALEGSNLSGTEQYARVGKNLWLKGSIDSTGKFTIEERYPEDTVTGIFKGNFFQFCQTMTGYFSKPDGSQLQPFEFHEVGAVNQSNTEAINAGILPWAMAINPVTNKIYVTDSEVVVIDGSDNSSAKIATVSSQASTSCDVAINPANNKVYVVNDNVTVINGSNNNTATLNIGGSPGAIAVNPITNKIYVANYIPNTYKANVTVINGSDNITANIAVESSPCAIAINPVTNKIYLANKSSDNVTVINGSDNTFMTIPTGRAPYAVAVNLVTNKIYVATQGSNTVTVINGADNSTATIAVGSADTYELSRYAIAVNPVTNMIYVANSGSNNVTVINGSDNSTTTVAVGSYPRAVAINPVTNKVYVVNHKSDNVTVINGSDNSTATIAVGEAPCAVVVNPATNKAYVANYGSDNVTVITE